MDKNIIVFKFNNSTIEFERFGDGAVVIEAEDQRWNETIVIQLDFSEVEQLAEFLGALVGMVNAD